MSEIRLYVEGGSSARANFTRVREGFNGFLSEVVSRARERGVRWSVIACGPRNEAYGDFSRALDTHPDAFNVLLVDAEGPVSTSPWAHLAARDGWRKPSAAGDSNCHLMVQAVEAWLIVDRKALQRFYGQGFRGSALPRNRHVEEIDRDTLLSTLRTATSATQKGAYHKTRHGPRILVDVDAAQVRAAAPHCDRLFTTLLQAMGATHQ